MKTKSFNLYRYSIPVDSQLILRGRFLKRRGGRFEDKGFKGDRKFKEKSHRTFKEKREFRK